MCILNIPIRQLGFSIKFSHLCQSLGEQVPAGEDTRGSEISASNHECAQESPRNLVEMQVLTLGSWSWAASL